MTAKLLLAAGALIASYLLGSISFAVIISKAVAKKDVRDFGSGNAGTTNVVRTVGLIPGIATFALDFLKGVAAALLGAWSFSALGAETGISLLGSVNGALLCGFICQIGHMRPLFFDFRGGKGVATTAGVMLVADWRVLIVLLAAFLIPFAFTRIISLGSVTAAVAAPLAFIPFHSTASPYDIWIEILLGLLLALGVLISHKENIKRLLRHEEKPIAPKKKS